MKKTLIYIGIALLLFVLFFRCFCGLFVIQPIGLIPKGATIVYWRTGLNLPFICSADGLLEESDIGVSLLGRGMMLAKFAETIKEKEIIRFGYSKQLYLYSTDGKEYDR